MPSRTNKLGMRLFLCAQEKVIQDVRNVPVVPWSQSVERVNKLFYNGGTLDRRANKATSTKMLKRNHFRGHPLRIVSQDKPSTRIQ